MNILNGALEESVILDSKQQKMYIAKKEPGCYVVEIKKDEDNKRVFAIPFCSLMDFNGLKIHEIFEEFIVSFLGNTILHGDFKHPKTLLDFENKTITILSDSSNNAVLRISYTKEEIKFEIIKLQENNLNSTIYLYSDGNLRGGYIRIFRELFERLNNLAIEPNKPKERIRRNNESV